MQGSRKHALTPAYFFSTFLFLLFLPEERRQRHICETLMSSGFGLGTDDLASVLSSTEKTVYVCMTVDYLLSGDAKRPVGNVDLGGGFQGLRPYHITKAITWPTRWRTAFASTTLSFCVTVGFFTALCDKRRSMNLWGWSSTKSAQVMSVWVGVNAANIYAIGGRVCVICVKQVNEGFCNMTKGATIDLCLDFSYIIMHSCHGEWTYAITTEGTYTMSMVLCIYGFDLGCC